jgi:hypothetical protein
MFWRKKEFIDGKEYAVIWDSYLKIGHHKVSLRKLAYLVLFAVLVILLITAEKPVLLPVAL